MVGRVGVPARHQLRHILEADVACLQLFVIQHADAAVPRQLVAFEGEIDFLDAVPFSARAELGFRTWSTAAEEDAFANVHFEIIAQLRIFASRKLIGTAPSSNTRS
jgi:hypothetical protein